MTIIEIGLSKLRRVTNSSHCANGNKVGWDTTGTEEIQVFRAGNSTTSGEMCKFDITIPTTIVESLDYLVLSIKLNGTSWPANIRYLILEGHGKTPNDLYNNRMNYQPHNNTDSIFYRQYNSLTGELSGNITGTTTTIAGGSTIYAKINLNGLKKGANYTLCFLENQDNLSKDGFINGVEDPWSNTYYKAYIVTKQNTSTIRIKTDNGYIAGIPYVYINGQYIKGTAYIKTNNGYKGG